MKSSKLPIQAAPVIRQSTSSAPIADGSGVEASQLSSAARAALAALVALPGPVKNCINGCFSGIAGDIL